MSILAIFQWLAATPLGLLIRDTKWGFAIVETVHLLALACLGGAVFLVNLRLLGVGLKRISPPALVDELRPWLTGSLILMIVSGVMLTAGEAMKCYYNPAFRLKMAALAASMIFSFFLHRSLLRLKGPEIPIAFRLAGAASLALWLSVGVAGRAIGLI